MEDMGQGISSESVEDEMWDALGLDDVTIQMLDTPPVGTGVVMGTGKSQGQCYQCDGSSTTAGCNGCN